MSTAELVSVDFIPEGQAEVLLDVEEIVAQEEALAIGGLGYDNCTRTDGCNRLDKCTQTGHCLG